MRHFRKRRKFRHPHEVVSCPKLLNNLLEGCSSDGKYCCARMKAHITRRVASFLPEPPQQATAGCTHTSTISPCREQSRARRYSLWPFHPLTRAQQFPCHVYLRLHFAPSISKCPFQENRKLVEAESFSMKHSHTIGTLR